MEYKLKIYFAGISGNTDRLNILIQYGFKNFMWSYIAPPSKKQLEMLKENNCNLLLDSGAYSAWKKGKEIDIYKYIEYIKKNNISMYFNLDVVGDIEKTNENQKIMEKHGLSPIPVFHYGSDFKQLKYLVDSGYTYIGLGGTVGKSTDKKIEFFDKCFELYPHINFHGLGVTSKKLIDMYNWFSVDSTTWLTPFKYRKEITKDGVQIKSEEKNSTKRFINSLEFFSKFK